MNLCRDDRSASCLTSSGLVPFTQSMPNINEAPEPGSPGHRAEEEEEDVPRGAGGRGGEQGVSIAALLTVLCGHGDARTTGHTLCKTREELTEVTQDGKSKNMQASGLGLKSVMELYNLSHNNIVASVFATMPHMWLSLGLLQGHRQVVVLKVQFIAKFWYNDMEQMECQHSPECVCWWLT